MITAIRDGIAWVRFARGARAPADMARFLGTNARTLDRILGDKTPLKRSHPMRARLCEDLITLALIAGSDDRRRRVLEVAKALGEDVFAPAYDFAHDRLALLLAQAGSELPGLNTAAGVIADRAGLARPGRIDKPT